MRPDEWVYLVWWLTHVFKIIYIHQHNFSYTSLFSYWNNHIITVYLLISIYQHFWTPTFVINNYNTVSIRSFHLQPQISKYLQVYIHYVHRRHVGMAPGFSAGSLKLKSHEQSSQTNTRQGIHEITDLQDVLLCTQQRIQTGEWTFLQWQPSCQKSYDSYTGMYNIWHYVHISISMDMKYVNQWSQSILVP